MSGHLNSLGAYEKTLEDGACIAVGVGCDAAAPGDELAALVAACLKEAGAGPAHIRWLASLERPALPAAVAGLAAAFDVGLTLFNAARLEAETPRLANPSAAVFARMGCHGVAEAAALAAAGPGSRLLLPKRKSARATCALALAAGPDPGQSEAP